MVAIIEHEKCMYCGGCTSVCPFLAMQLKETFLHVYPEKCIDCGICIRACPVGAIKVIKNDKILFAPEM